MAFMKEKIAGMPPKKLEVFIGNTEEHRAASEEDLPA